MDKEYNVQALMLLRVSVTENVQGTEMNYMHANSSKLSSLSLGFGDL